MILNYASSLFYEIKIRCALKALKFLHKYSNDRYYVFPEQEIEKRTRKKC